MSRPRALAAAVALFVMAVASFAGPPAGAVMGGFVASPTTAPSVVALLDSRFENQFCAGTVVAPTWVLTAAHCAVAYRTQPSVLHVVSGRIDLRATTGVEVAVSEVIIHPAFDRAARRNDLALLRLPTPLAAPVAALMSPDVEPAYDGTTAGLVVGWGSITPDGNTAVFSERFATIPVFGDDHCLGLIGSFIGDNQVCAGANGIGACTGDSGGPLFVADTKGTTRVAGVVSYGSDPCDVTPAGFSQVSANLQFLQSTIGQAAPPPAPTPPPAPSPTPSPAPAGNPGYWMLGADGKVYPFGSAPAFGDLSGGPDGSAVGITPTPDNKGYWIVTTTGRVSQFGSAPALGSVAPGTLIPGELVTGMATTPTGQGYVVFTTRGRAVAFGDAPAAGDMTATALNGPVLGGIVTPSGKGYYMVASDGGIFTFGDAAFRGSMGGKRLNAPVRGLVPTATGGGYWLVASDGGIFTFGDAPFLGSMGATPLNRPVVGMVRYGNGYLMVGSDGGIFTFSNLAFVGSLGASPPVVPISSVAVVA